MKNNKDLKLNKFSALGVIHIHSIFSDGTGDIDTISKAAKKAGLDWIIITDHNSFEIKEGFYNGVYVIKGEELSPKDNKNHYIALGINRNITPACDVQLNIDAVRENGGFGVAAHPYESDKRKNPYPPIKWTDKNAIPDGVEIWNWFSQWADKLNDKNLFTLAYAYLFKHNLVKEPYRKTLDWWDNLNNCQDKIFPATGGGDIHALKISKYLIPVTVFPYETIFRTITNVLSLDEPLSKDFETGKKQILNAIKSGRNLIVNRKVSKYIPQFIVSNSKATVCSGEKIALDANTLCTVNTKRNSLIKVFRDGIEIQNIVSQNLKLLLNKVGKYRVEIKIKDRGFAYSNPVIVY